MVDYISKRLTQKMVEENIVKFDDQDIYYFRMQLLIATVLKATGIFIVAAALGLVKESIAFILPFAALRINAGGFHLKTYFKCFMTTTAFMILTIYTGINIPSYISMYFIYSSLGISLILILIYAPKDNPNKVLSNKEYIIYRKRSVYSIILLILFILLLYFSGAVLYKYCNIASLSILLEALTLIPSVSRKSIYQTKL